MANSDLYETLFQPKQSKKSATAAQKPDNLDDRSESHSRAIRSKTREKSVQSGPSKSTLALTAISIAALLLAAWTSMNLGKLQSSQQSMAASVENSLSDMLERIDETAQQTASLQSGVEAAMERVGLTQADLEESRKRAFQLREAQAAKVKAMVMPQLTEIQTNLRTLSERVEELSGLESDNQQKLAEAQREIAVLSGDMQNNQQQMTQVLEQLGNLSQAITQNKQQPPPPSGPQVKSSAAANAGSQ